MMTLPSRASGPPGLAIGGGVFGLIHGLGSAGALCEIRLPDSDIPLSLFSFNAGVELGQILFVGLVLAVCATARHLYPEIIAQPDRLTLVASHGMGSLAALRVTDRVAGI